MTTLPQTIARDWPALSPVIAVFAIWLTDVCAQPESAEAQTLRPEDFAFAGHHTAVTTVDGDTIVLDDGRELRLTGIQAPKLPLGRPNFKAWPLATEAKKTLETLANGQSFALYVDEAAEDRYRRILAHPIREDGMWLQEEMIRLGLARVYSFPDNRRTARTLYDVEQTARSNGRGIWALDYYAIREPDPEDLLEETGTFQIVEGRVSAAARQRTRIYLNFGADYRTDFTASIARSVWPMFEEAGIDPLAYTDQRIRVRGWIRDFNGPLIEVTHPEQIELVSE